MDIQWERATEEVKSFYGKDYFYRFFLKDNRENSAESPDKVIEAVVDALLNEAPRARYLVPGSSRLIDIHAVSLDIHAMCGSRFILGVGDGGPLKDIHAVIKPVYLRYTNRNSIYMRL